MNRPRYYRCPSCGNWHRWSEHNNPPCSTVARDRAIEQIDRLLAQAFGHGARDSILRRAAQWLDVWAAGESWGPELRSDYASTGHILSRYLKAAELERPRREPGKRPLTADECAEVLKYWPLVKSEAQKIARKDEELYDKLTAIGMDALESSARRWDGARGFTLGAFAQQRVRGSMLNYLVRDLNREPKGQDPADDEGKRWFRGMTRKPRLESFVAEWLAATPEPKSYLIPGKRSLDALEVALAKLNPRQRAVYRGRVLQNPPLSRAALARELGITDLTQISRIEKQARQKMKKCHPPCTKPGI